MFVHLDELFRKITIFRLFRVFRQRRKMRFKVVFLGFLGWLGSFGSKFSKKAKTKRFYNPRLRGKKRRRLVFGSPQKESFARRNGNGKEEDGARLGVDGRYWILVHVQVGGGRSAELVRPGRVLLGTMCGRERSE